MDDIILTVNGEVVYDNTNNQTEEATIPTVASPVVEQPAPSVSDNIAHEYYIYADKYRTATDVDDQSAIELAVNEANQTGKPIILSAGRWNIKHLLMPKRGGILGLGDCVINAVDPSVERFLQFNDDAGRNRAGLWSNKQKLDNISFAGKIQGNWIDINAALDFDIGSIWFDGVRGGNKLVDMAWAFGGKFDLLNASKAQNYDTALNLYDYATTTAFGHVYTGGPINPYGVVLDGKSGFSCQQLTLQSHSKTGLWVKENSREVCVQNFYGEGSIQDIRAGSSEENKTSWNGIKIVSGATGVPSESHPNYNERYAAVFLDKCAGVEFDRGFKFASSVARNSAGKKAVHAIAFNEILDSEIKRGYFYSVDNGNSKPLALDCVKTTNANDSKIKRAIIEGAPISSAVTKRSDTHP